MNMVAGLVPASQSTAPDAVRNAAHEIIEMGRFLSVRGMVPATSGNFSRRIDHTRIAITASGVDKGELTAGDVLVIDADQPPPRGTSAETLLHVGLYRDRPLVGAVLHTHSVAATLVSMLRQDEGCLRLCGYEMQKALAGTTSHDTEVTIPVFANSQDIPALAGMVSARLAGEPAAVGYLLAGHGLYAWGRDMAEARRHTVALEFLLTCELERMRIGR